MKIHTHVLFSVAYVGGITFITGHGIDDPFLYFSSLLGGEILDILDHPLYYLVYKRKNPHVVKLRKLFKEKGFRAAKAFSDKLEENRLLKGFWLHNIFALIFAALLGIGASLFLHSSVYPFVFLGSLILHMILDILGDFVKLGHVDNWLWVLPNSFLKKIGKYGSSVVYGVIFLNFFIIFSFLMISLRWSLQIVNSSTYFGLFHRIIAGQFHWILYLPILFFGLYICWVMGISTANMHKYHLEIKKRKSKWRAYFGSFKLIRDYLFGRLKRNRYNLEKIILRMQVDSATWIFSLALFICILLHILTFLSLDNNLIFFLIPIFFSILFGTFIHTIIGEIACGMGMFLAVLINILFSRIQLQEIWSLSRIYILLAAAITAWFLGLFSSIIFKGIIRMSLVVFIIKVQNKKNVIIGHDNFQNKTLTIVKNALEEGYKIIHEKLFGDFKKDNFIEHTYIEMAMAPHINKPIIGDDYLNLIAKDNYVPGLKEFAYVLCDNLLLSLSRKIGDYGLLPVMPRYRIKGSVPEEYDMHLDGDNYNWHSSFRKVKFQIDSPVYSSNQASSRWGLTKTYGEFIDGALTQRSTIETNLSIFPFFEDEDTITICGITRECTSTKEYATVEAETYSWSVLKQILKNIIDTQNNKLVQKKSLLIFYPHISYFDQELMDDLIENSVLPSKYETITKSDYKIIKKAIDLLSSKNLVSTATSNLGKKTILLLANMFIAGLIAALGLERILLKIISNLMDKAL